jgi:hypothetical protein
MTLTKKQIYYGLGGVAVLGVGYWLWKKNEDNKAQLAQAQQQTENAKAMLVKQAEEAQTEQEGDGAPDAYGGGGGMSGGMYQPPIAVVIPESIHDLIPPTTPTASVVTPATTTAGVSNIGSGVSSPLAQTLISNITAPSTITPVQTTTPSLVGVAGSPAASGTTTTPPIVRPTRTVLGGVRRR